MMGLHLFGDPDFLASLSLTAGFKDPRHQCAQKRPCPRRNSLLDIVRIQTSTPYICMLALRCLLED
jgi:hypothetical protein